MKLKEIKELYDIYPYEKGYMLFDIAKPGYVTKNKYAGYIKFKQNKARVDGFDYTFSLDVLNQQLASWESSLAYRTDYYIPMYRESAFVEMVISEYMSDFGFKWLGCNFGADHYILKPEENVYDYNISGITITLDGIREKYDFKTNKSYVSDTVKVILWSSKYSGIKSTCKREVEAIKTTIDSLIKPVLLSEGVNLIKSSDKFTNIKSIDLQLFDLKNNTTDKIILKQKLLELAETL